MLFNLIKPGYVIGILIIEVFIAIFLSARITKMQPMTAKILYFVYSFTTGLSLSFVFVVYEITSIIYVFAVTSLLFGIFALMGLIALVLVTLINLFIGSETIDLILCYAGIIIFLGYIAYDMQKVKYLQNVIPDQENLSIFCAFQLYLDFINLFYRLISLFGKSKD